MSHISSDTGMLQFFKIRVITFHEFSPTLSKLSFGLYKKINNLNTIQLCSKNLRLKNSINFCNLFTCWLLNGLTVFQTNNFHLWTIFGSINDCYFFLKMHFSGCIYVMILSRNIYLFTFLPNDFNAVLIPYLLHEWHQHSSEENISKNASWKISNWIKNADRCFTNPRKQILKVEWE